MGEQLAANLAKKASLSGAQPLNHLHKNDCFGYMRDDYTREIQFALKVVFIKTKNLQEDSDEALSDWKDGGSLGFGLARKAQPM
jgi:hypothetical protein